MLEAPQIIDLLYDGRRHWFEVWRYATEDSFFAALHADKIVKYPKGTIAYTDNYAAGDEAGRMYLLDKSVSTLAHEAMHMALGILARHGHTGLVLTTNDAPQLEEDLGALIGTITSELYSKSKYF